MADPRRAACRLSAVGFWLWAASIAGFAGFLGSSLNCDASIALVPASAFVVLVVLGRRWSAALSLGVSVVLLSYAFFAGLTTEGRALLCFGPLLGVAAVAFTQRRARQRPRSPAQAR